MTIDSIQHVSVIGLGTMGHGIAQSFALAGCEVRCYDEQPSARKSLLSRIRANLRQMCDAGVIASESIEPALERISVSDSLGDTVKDAQFVTEAVREDLTVKQALFTQLESLVAPKTILASNSSSYPITRTAAQMHRPERAIVTHWFNPPHIVPLVEVVPGDRTSDETAQVTYQLLQHIGKRPVRLSKEVPGFLVNRVQIAMFREIWDLLERGVASAEEIDAAIRFSMGFRLAAIGPLAVNDFAGLDVTGRVYENLITDLRSDTELPVVIRQLIDNSQFGTKTGSGIFNYTPQSIAEQQRERDRRYLTLIRLMQEES